MKLNNILQPQKNLWQGDWVKFGNKKGIYILSLSSSKAVVATYINKNKKYISVYSSDLIKINRINDNKLFNFAKKHILWRSR